MERVLVVIPAHNEERSIGGVLGQVKRSLPKADILVVNDFSTDKTREVVKRRRGVILINNVFNMGYALSVQTGIIYAYQNNYDYVIQMDADGQHSAKDAKRMYEYAKKNGTDIVLGSRYIDNSGYKVPFFRRFGAFLFRVLILLFCHKTIKDPLTGLQCINRKIIEAYAMPGEYPKYPDAGLLIKMHMSGASIAEVPATMKERKEGVSMHSGILKPIQYMFTQTYICLITFMAYAGKAVKKHE